VCLTEYMHPAEPGSYLLCRSVLGFSLQKKKKIVLVYFVKGRNKIYF